MGSTTAELLLEIGCEEIPARMIGAASKELERRLLEILADAGLAHGPARSWSGSRRFAVWVDAVVGRQNDRSEQILGPPAKIAFGADGAPSRAALGFARKQGIDAERLKRIDTDRGSYVGYLSERQGKTLGEVLAEQLPAKVGSMTFPKTMRWADGTHRWVRPVHWILALHGPKTLKLTMFGIESGNCSRGHRFRSSGPVEIDSPANYVAALEEAGVVVAPAERRERLTTMLAGAADAAGGVLVEDQPLLDEVADLVEWPGVVVGQFDAGYLELPTELLSTTLRHHQKCFSLVDKSGRALAAFLAIANTDEDPDGHIQRGNEWVVGGRLEDARFFWREDLRTTLDARTNGLAGMMFHAKVGDFAEKIRRMESLVRRFGERLGLDAATIEQAATAAALCKNDLLTGTVGEFPELQGQVGGLMLRAEEQPAAVAQAVYEHYRPAGASDRLPETVPGGLVSMADKLDSIASLIGAGETPTGSRDPLGLRRASSGVFRIVIDAGWNISINSLAEISSGGEAVADYLADRLKHALRETGATSNEIQSVCRPGAVGTADWRDWALADIGKRLASIGGVRDRADFDQLVDLTKRVDNILTKSEPAFEQAAASASATEHREDQTPAIRLAEKLAGDAVELERLVGERRYDAVVDLLAGYVEPVEQFFVDVLVVDKDNPAATLARRDLLKALHDLLTGCFDLRELAGQAERRVS